MKHTRQDGSPLRVAFPVVDCEPYTLHFKGKAVLFGMCPIEPAHPLRDPNPQCEVIGQLEDGRHVQFTVPLKVWQDAFKNPVMFQAVPMDSIGARPGVLVDANGQPLPSRYIKSTGQDAAT